MMGDKDKALGGLELNKDIAQGGLNHSNMVSGGGPLERSKSTQIGKNRAPIGHINTPIDPMHQETQGSKNDNKNTDFNTPKSTTLDHLNTEVPEGKSMNSSAYIDGINKNNEGYNDTSVK